MRPADGGGPHCGRRFTPTSLRNRPQHRTLCARPPCLRVDLLDRHQGIPGQHWRAVRGRSPWHPLSADKLVGYLHDLPARAGFRVLRFQLRRPS